MPDTNGRRIAAVPPSIDVRVIYFLLFENRADVCLVAEDANHRERVMARRVIHVELQ